MAEPPRERVVAYFDGFNLYFGLRDSRYRRYYWLDLKSLAKNLVKSHQDLVRTKYFTSRLAGAGPSDPPDRAKHRNEERARQTLFLDALDTLTDFERHDGHFLAKPVRCRKCKSSWSSYEEKMTDVQIATEMLTDAFDDRFDTALLISADSDLVPPTRAIRRMFPKKRIVVAFPPARSSIELRQAADVAFQIGRRTLAKSLLPDEVTTLTGHVLKRPPEWT